MNSEIYKLLMEHGELDYAFIYQAFGMMIERERDLIPFINGFNVTTEDSDSYGTYDINDWIIKIYLKPFYELSEEKNLKMHALSVIRHEIEHARNMQRLYQCRNDIESTVIRYSLKDYATKHHLGYRGPYDRSEFEMFFRGRARENYDLDPGERIARIKAWRYVVNLLKNQRRTEDLLAARVNLYRAYIRGYEDNGWYLNAPTYEFLLKTGMYHDFYLFKQRVEKEEYVFDTRLLYGLPLIKDKEFDKKILAKVRLEKRKKQG